MTQILFGRSLKYQIFSKLRTVTISISNRKEGQYASDCKKVINSPSKLRLGLGH